MDSKTSAAQQQIRQERVATVIGFKNWLGSLVREAPEYFVLAENVKRPLDHLLHELHHATKHGPE